MKERFGIRLSIQLWFTTFCVFLLCGFFLITRDRVLLGDNYLTLFYHSFPLQRSPVLAASKASNPNFFSDIQYRILERDFEPTVPDPTTCGIVLNEKLRILLCMYEGEETLILHVFLHHADYPQHFDDPFSGLTGFGREVLSLRLILGMEVILVRRMILLLRQGNR
jgi:hypothetical protein